jgi:hypothetical protein
MIARCLLALLWLLPLAAQAENRINQPNIKTLVTMVNQNWLNAPVMRLHSDDVLTVEFDELSHDYHRYVYRLEHCEADWTPSEELFESDWLSGFNGNPIEDYAHSINTIVPYTHYQLQLPNDRCQLLMSGNYRLYILDEDDDNREVLVTEFMVTEQTMRLSLSSTPNTDIDTRQSHQQVTMAIDYGNLPVTNPDTQIYAVVMQNHQQRNMRQGIKPNITTRNGLEWSHNRELIFDAGNEYRKFEVLDVSHPTMGIDHITWDGENYQAYTFVDAPRPNYLYDEDANGAFCIRNSDYREVSTTGEYVWVNYRLRVPHQGPIFISGRFATATGGDDYMLYYDPVNQLYTASILQKQGYYNYQYTTADGQQLPSEGNYYQTKNQYQALIYYKGTTDRTWRLSAFGDTDRE